ncbi:MAG: iron chelate uptake ABC transporter family permease subunit [Candidatus Bathyarchaeota archaeon]|nr:iron chelate uptake ABC transporter family permease subunit [Candidatus Bathyarchaeota archaeon]
MSTDEVESAYFRRTSRWKLIVLLLLVALFVTVLVSLNVGYAQIPFENILAIIGKQIPFLNGAVDSSLVLPTEAAIILQIRLPRITAGVVVGAALAASGVVYQGVFKNPMADSYVLGVSAGAAVGASFSILFGAGIALFGFRLVQVAAFLGALFAMFLVYNISRVGSRVPVTTLLLCGIAVNFFLYAIVALLEVIAGEQLHAIVFWLIGGFSNVLWADIWAVLPFIIIGTVASYFYARDLNLLALGEDQAQHLGVNVEKVKQILLIFASMVTAAAVSLSGLVGFVGLMVPHITRLVIGPDHRILFPASTIVGAIFLVVCDAIARVIATPFASTLELPVGIVTMLAGAPFFIILFRKKKQSYAL